MSEWKVFRGTPAAEQRRREAEADLASTSRSAPRLTNEWLRARCLEAGAGDAGFVEIDRAALGAEREHALRIFPGTQTLVGLVTMSNPDAIRSVSRATANLAWHHNHAELDEVAQRLVHTLNAAGVRAVATSIGFPMRHEPGQTTWEIAHKVVAVQAGLGHMGINRNVIHPRFGNFVLLETILIDAELDSYDEPLDYNPCNGCNLCVAACPVGAVRTDDHFDFMACLEHNYREFLFGFEDWVGTIADGDSRAYTSKFAPEETRSMWQSISFGPNYKSAYCQAVCPAGDDVIGPYMADRARWRDEVMVPLLRKTENIYVRSGTRAEKVALRNPSKRVRYIDYRPDVSTQANFTLGLRHRFDADRATGVAATVQFNFPDETSTVVAVADQLLSIDAIEYSEPHAVVTLTGDRYIRLLHPDGAPSSPGSEPIFRLEGDPAALGAILACLS